MSVRQSVNIVHDKGLIMSKYSLIPNAFKSVNQIYNESLMVVTDYHFPKDHYIEWNAQTSMFDLQMDLLDAIDPSYLDGIDVDSVTGAFHDALIGILEKKKLSFTVK